MSDRFYPVPIARLFTLLKQEWEARRSMLGLPRTVFFTPSASDRFRSRRYGRLLETPVGVAAGPHTQLTQNLVAAWLCGARYLELKTVQTLDTIEVTKPCIDAADEGYNCEWSQELTLAQSEEEYCKAWVLIHVLQRFLGHDIAPSELGCLFNISVGYNMEGIREPNVQHFLDAMTRPNPRIRELCAELAPLVPDLALGAIPDIITDHVTISTMHGCPPDEIEGIAAYFIAERRLHTAVKCNPTLLGPVALRTILNDVMGFEVDVPDAAFEHDLKWEDAIGLIARLLEKARETGVAFGVKLTNTLESCNIRRVLPAKETMHYMSGRALHPVSLELAHRLSEQFGGTLDISFCAGIDADNVADVLSCGLTPVTVCTDLLKPGGYARLSQYMENISTAFEATKFELPETGRVGGPGGDRAVLFEKLQALAARTLHAEACRKGAHPWDSIKGRRELGPFDCVKAPCVESCPTNQKVPLYIALAAEGRHDEALRVILEDNPLPHATGMACDHKCQERCTRINYDSPVLIREIKRYVARNGQVPAPVAGPEKGVNVGVIGAGPAGLSAAYYLTLAGARVTVYDENGRPGGLLERALPGFRLDRGFLRRDFERILSMEVTWKQERVGNRDDFNRIVGAHDAVFLGVGARASRELHIEGEDLPGVVPFLDFLEGVNEGRIKNIGHRTVIIGGGNSAMDVARTAQRLRREHDHVMVLYRRTRKEMPADLEEIRDLLEEGIEIRELVAPIRAHAENGRLNQLLCARMTLSDPDESGRRRPVPEPDGEFVLPVDMILSAVGQDPELGFLDGTAVALTRWGTVAVRPDGCATGHEKVFAGGDVVRGPMSIIAAVADGKNAAREIGQRHGLVFPKDRLPKAVLPARADLILHRARRWAPSVVAHTGPDARATFAMVAGDLTTDQLVAEARRCLACHLFCDVCVSVCPNRANISYEATRREWSVPSLVREGDHFGVASTTPLVISQEAQVANIKDYCNECGNCVTFCPSAGRPFADKPRLAISMETFDREPETVFCERTASSHTVHFHAPEGDGLVRTSPGDPGFTFEWRGARGTISWADFTCTDATGGPDTLDLAPLAPVAVLLDAFVRGTLIL
ncbi:FAD-dependent oxidoreductase [Myxococcota bacterium]|nr:FAD-dependent oxidoreductase [Myxococcota bacterium]